MVYNNCTLYMLLYKQCRGAVTHTRERRGVATFAHAHYVVDDTIVGTGRYIYVPTTVGTIPGDVATRWCY